MTNIIEIKPLIRNFIVENLDNSFQDNVYWLGERLDVPDTLYCLLTVISETKDKRTSSHSGRYSQSVRDKIWTIYKTATITITIVYNAMEGSFRAQKEFAYEQIHKLEQLFEIKDVNKFYSINRISPIRALHEPVTGGYQYRFEFDLTIGYNETVTMEKLIGNAVQVEVRTENYDKDMIGFVVELDEDDKSISIDNDINKNNDNCNCNL